MIKHQVRTSAVVNPKVLDAMSRVPRENFVDPSVRSIAYSDTMLPIGCAELMLPSRTHGLVMQHIEPDPKDHVLIIGGGTGYLSGCLSTLVKKIYAIEKHSSDEMLERLKRTLALFVREAPKHPRVLAIGLHPHLIGVPHRFGSFEQMLDLLLQTPGVCFKQGHEIADWFSAQVPPPAA